MGLLLAALCLAADPGYVTWVDKQGVVHASEAKDAPAGAVPVPEDEVSTVGRTEPMDSQAQQRDTAGRAWQVKFRQVRAELDAAQREADRLGKELSTTPAETCTNTTTTSYVPAPQTVTRTGLVVSTTTRAMVPVTTTTRQCVPNPGRGGLVSRQAEVLSDKDRLEVSLRILEEDAVRQHVPLTYWY